MSISPEAVGLTDKERQLIERLFSNPLLIPLIFKTWLVNYLGTELTVTASQVVSQDTDVFEGAGTPEGATAANVGSIYLRTDGGAGTSVYFKESGTGTTGWKARNVFSTTLTLEDGTLVSIGSGSGSKIGDTGAKIGFMGAAPVARPGTYNATNVAVDRAYDADATTVAELADVLGTLISDLRSLGLIA